MSVPQEDEPGVAPGAGGDRAAPASRRQAGAGAAAGGGRGGRRDRAGSASAGSASAGDPAGDAVPAESANGSPSAPEASWRGRRLGAPPSGPGSLAGYGARLGAFFTDVVLSALVAGLFTAPELPRNWSLVAFLAESVVFGAAFGQTPGMRLFGLRLIRVDRPARVGVPRMLVRTLLLVLLVPALIWDADGRGLHERFSQTAVVRTGGTAR